MQYIAIRIANYSMIIVMNIIMNIIADRQQGRLQHLWLWEEERAAGQERQRAYPPAFLRAAQWLCQVPSGHR